MSPSLQITWPKPRPSHVYPEVMISLMHGENQSVNCVQVQSHSLAASGEQPRGSLTPDVMCCLVVDVFVVLFRFTWKRKSVLVEDRSYVYISAIHPLLSPSLSLN